MSGPWVSRGPKGRNVVGFYSADLRGADWYSLDCLQRAALIELAARRDSTTPIACSTDEMAYALKISEPEAADVLEGLRAATWIARAPPSSVKSRNSGVRAWLFTAKVPIVRLSGKRILELAERGTTEPTAAEPGAPHQSSRRRRRKNKTGGEPQAETVAP